MRWFGIASWCCRVQGLSVQRKDRTLPVLIPRVFLFVLNTWTPLCCFSILPTAGDRQQEKELFCFYSSASSLFVMILFFVFVYSVLFVSWGEFYFRWRRQIPFLPSVQNSTSWKTASTGTHEGALLLFFHCCPVLGNPKVWHFYCIYSDTFLFFLCPIVSQPIC